MKYEIMRDMVQISETHHTIHSEEDKIEKG